MKASKSVERRGGATEDDERDLPQRDPKDKRNIVIRSGLFVGYLARDAVSGLLQATGFTIGTVETVPGAGKAVTALVNLVRWCEDEAAKGRTGALKWSAKRRIRRAYCKLLKEGPDADLEGVRRAVKGLPIPESVVNTVIAQAIRDEELARANKEKQQVQAAATEAASA